MLAVKFGIILLFANLKHRLYSNEILNIFINHDKNN